MTRNAHPPRGWNSFDSYGLHLNDEAARANLRVFADRLAPCGYEYFVIDGGWYNEYELLPGSLLPAQREPVGCRMDAFGRYLPSRCYFAHGLKSIFDEAHALNVKAGVHIMRGIPRRAVVENTPIFGVEGVTARDIADLDSVCSWSTTNYGIDMKKRGAQEYYDGWIVMLAQWGADFIKADDILGHPAEITAIADAIERSGRPMLLSLSPGGDFSPAFNDIYRRADMCRVTHDIWDRSGDITDQFEAWRDHQGDPDYWVDLDMVPVGSLLVPFGRGSNSSSASSAEHGRGSARVSRLSPAEQRTMITMQALACSPVFFGGDLLSSDEDAFRLVTNVDMLACSANGRPATLIRDEIRGLQTWRTDTRDGSMSWLGVFNRSDAPTQLAALGDMTGMSVRDVWSGSSEIGADTLIGAGDVLFLVMCPQR